MGAGLVLTGEQFVPLARARFSNRHPSCKSQNKREAAVLGAAWERPGRGSSASAGRPASSPTGSPARLRHPGPQRDFVIRVDAAVTGFTAAFPEGTGLAVVSAAPPAVGEVVWDRGQAGKVRCEARALSATIRFRRSGRQHDSTDSTDATRQVVELLPLDGGTGPLVLATPLPIDALAALKGVGRGYAWRWSSETGFETMKGWGLGRFLVRAWPASDRLLWLVAVAYALLVVAARDGPLAILREQAVALLKRLAVRGRRLTAGKLAEAIGLDDQRHRRAWTTTWLT